MAVGKVINTIYTAAIQEIDGLDNHSKLIIETSYNGGNGLNLCHMNWQINQVLLRVDKEEGHSI